MKNYTITVNGNIYDVTVEEKIPEETTPVKLAASVLPKVAPKLQPAPKAAPKVAPNAPSKAGKIEVKAGAAGKVFKLVAKVGQALKKGDPVVIIEAMKMEIPVVAPEAGTVASIDVSAGDSVEAGDLLATLN